MPAQTDILAIAKARLAEIEAEATQLRKVIAMLGEPEAKPTGAKTPAATNGHKGDKREMILAELATGMKPKAIAAKLGCSVNYVYLTKRESEK